MEVDKQEQKAKGRTLDIRCKVCNDFSTGKHYGIYACDGCSGFFKRSIRRKREYTCRAVAGKGNCAIDKVHRNQCRACRLTRCFQVNMNKDAVQHERGPRSSAIQQHKRLQRNSGVSSIQFSSEHAQHLEAFTIKLRSAEPDLKIVPFNNCDNTSSPLIHDPEVLSEMVARLLFKCVGWVKNISGFLNICFNDQVLLLEESWSELYILGVSQNPQIFNNPLFFAVQTDCPDNQSTNDAPYVCILKTILERLHALKLDTVEYLFLKAICFLKPIVQGLKDVVKVEMLQDRMQEMLGEYETKIEHNDNIRFGRILLVSAGLARIEKKVIEEIFFKKNIGCVPVGNILNNMHLSDEHV